MIQPPFPEFLPDSVWQMPETFPNIGRAKWLSLDCESRDPHLQQKGPGFIRGDAYIAGVAIHTDGFSGYYPVRHAQGANLAPNVVFEWLQDEIKQFNGELYGANLIYDLEGLWLENVRFNDTVKYRDIQIAEPILDEETAEGYSLEVLSRKYLGEGKEEFVLREAARYHTKGYKDKRAKRPIPFDPKGDLWMLAPQFVGEYAQADVDLPRRIFQDHQSKLIEKEGLQQIFDLEASLLPILLKMRIQGVAVDLDRAEVLRKKLTIEIDKMSVKIRALVGFDPNTDSGKDVLRAYETLNFKMPEFGIDRAIRYTQHGNPSFTSEWYTAQRDPLSRLIQKKKKLLTLRDDFVIGDIINEATNGRLHAQFHPLRQDDSGTRSGRFSSTHPNLQQVPARHDGCDSDCKDNCTQHLWGKTDPNWSEEIRSLFIADKINPYGTQRQKFFKGDYSQQEPRLLLHFANLCKLPGSEVAVEAFRKNPYTDYHTLTTKIVNEKSGKNFKRKQIKGVNLGIMYGMGLKKLCRMLGVSESDGAEILAAYHDALPFVKGLSTKAMSIAQERGFILTILKRKRRFNLWEPVPEKKEDRQFRPTPLPRAQAEQVWPGRRLQRFGVHKALNSLIQGSAADQTKEAMRVLYYDFGKVPLLQVHDELCSSVADMEEGRIYKKTMQECVLLEIPVVCDGKLGDSWGTAKEEVLLAAA